MISTIGSWESSRCLRVLGSLPLATRFGSLITSCVSNVARRSAGNDSHFLFLSGPATGHDSVHVLDRRLPPPRALQDVERMRNRRGGFGGPDLDATGRKFFYRDLVAGFYSQVPQHVLRQRDLAFGGDSERRHGCIIARVTLCL